MINDLLYMSLCTAPEFYKKKKEKEKDSETSSGRW